MAGGQASLPNVKLYGYKFSVYAWIARLALHEKGVAYEWSEVDPFADDVDPAYLELHPFCRVPVLQVDDFVLFETGAITRFIDAHFDGPELQPGDTFEKARIDQVISIIDSYAYWPLVRQVFSHGVFRPLSGEEADATEIVCGLEAAGPVLKTLDRLTDGTTYMVGNSVTLADIHLAPMISYFVSSPDGQDLLNEHANLKTWWATMSNRRALIETTPDLSSVACI